jgi:hypothetical protein
MAVLGIHLFAKWRADLASRMNFKCCLRNGLFSFYAHKLLATIHFAIFLLTLMRVAFGGQLWAILPIWAAVTLIFMANDRHRAHCAVCSWNNFIIWWNLILSANHRLLQGPSFALLFSAQREKRARLHTFSSTACIGGISFFRYTAGGVNS